MALSDVPQIPPAARAKYLGNRVQDLQRCREALACRDYEPIQRIAHKMKGNGVTFGFPELTPYGDRLEMLARERNATAVSALLDEIDTWLSRRSVSVDKPV